RFATRLAELAALCLCGRIPTLGASQKRAANMRERRGRSHGVPANGPRRYKTCQLAGSLCRAKRNLLGALSSVRRPCSAFCASQNLSPYTLEELGDIEADLTGVLRSRPKTLISNLE